MTESAALMAQIRSKIQRYDLAKTAEGRFWAQHLRQTLDDHTDVTDGTCRGCDEPWPCTRLRGDAAGWE